MSGLPWNDQKVRRCNCPTCDAKPDPSCLVCRADGVEIDEWGYCGECRPGDEETCEEFVERMKARRATR